MKTIREVKISIVMPAYNASKNIPISIDSVLSQTYKNWELLIVNDCSSDNTLELIRQYEVQDARIRVIDLPKNKGVANARNQAINQAAGELIAFLDSDDFWTEDKLEKQSSFMLNNDYKFTYSNFYVILEDGIIVDERVAAKKATFSDLLKSNYIGCLTVMVDAQLMKNHLMKKIGHEDYLTWLGILKTGIKAYNVNDSLAYYRVSPDSLSGSKFKAASWQWNIYRDELDINIFKSAYYFFNYVIKGVKKGARISKNK